MSASFCPHCGRRLPDRHKDTELEQESPLDGPPSPPGAYHWAGVRWSFDIQRIAAFLGKRPDAQLARVVGTTPERIRRVRRSLGIPVYHSLRGFEHLIGKISDVEICRRSGADKKTVSRYRKKHGIPRVPTSRVRADKRLKAYIDELEKLFERVPTNER